MATITMRQIRDGEVPPDGGTAVQEDADRRVFYGNGPDDYVCVQCDNVLAVGMHPVQMTRKVRVRCGRCSTVNVSGNGSYRSAVFVPSRVGTFRWTVSYSGDPNHAPTSAGCGKATSSVSPASPSIASNVTQRLTVGTSFRVTATLQGGYTPAGTITFEIYRRVAAGCAKPVAVGVVSVAGNGTFSSDPLVARQSGTYSFGASYSGDAANQGATDPCDPSDPAIRVYRRTPQVKPRARLNEGNQISIRAHLSGAASPSGVINFRLYRPGDNQCKRKPAFSGGLTIRSNGSYLLAQYFATKPGVYRLSVGYSGDQRNRQYKPTCRGAQQIRIG